jgi:hypothetical protein
MNRMWNAVLLENVEESFVVNFLVSQFQAQQTSINLLINSGLLGHFWTRNLIKTACAYRRETRQNKGWVRTHTTETTETSCTRDRHLEIVSSQSDEAVNFNLFKRYRTCVCVHGHHFQQVSWFYCFYGAILDSYRENRVALGDESYNSCRKPGGDSCVLVYQWTHCRNTFCEWFIMSCMYYIHVFVWVYIFST